MSMVTLGYDGDGFGRWLFGFIEGLDFHVMISCLFFGSRSEVFLHAQEGRRKHPAVQAQRIKIALVLGQTRDASCRLTGGPSVVGAVSRRGVAPG
jgi:hypothetical protein